MIMILGSHTLDSVESIELNDNVSGDQVLFKVLAAPITPSDIAHVSHNTPNSLDKDRLDQ